MTDELIAPIPDEEETQPDENPAEETPNGDNSNYPGEEGKPVA